jgi:hypothetical protein
MRHSIRQALGITPGEHPPYETIAEVVDGTADDVTREIVESHAAACTRCDAELRDLHSFAGRPSRPEYLRWLGAAAAIVAVLLSGWYLLRRRPVEGIAKPQARERSTVAVRPPRAPETGSGYGRDDWDAAVRTALARGAIDPPAILGELRVQRDVLRGSGQRLAAAIMNPMGEVIDSPTPELTWRAAPGHFLVSVYHGMERVARSGPLRAAHWRVSPPLARGRTYTWQVEIVRGASVVLLAPPPAPPAFFHVLDADTSAMLAEARRRFPRDHLLLGVLHARAGMQQGAVEELRAANAGALAGNVARW